MLFYKVIKIILQILKKWEKEHLIKKLYASEIPYRTKPGGWFIRNTNTAIHSLKNAKTSSPTASLRGAKRRGNPDRTVANCRNDLDDRTVLCFHVINNSACLDRFASLAMTRVWMLLHRGITLRVSAAYDEAALVLLYDWIATRPSAARDDVCGDMTTRSMTRV